MKKVVIVGAGPTGLFVADQLVSNKNLQIELYEKNLAMGAKFLVAGKSGLNITHSEEIDKFQTRYFANEKLFVDLLRGFNNQDLINWVHGLGIETFVGTSGRVFPKNFKASKILKMWSDRLKSHDNFSYFPKHELSKISASEIQVNDKTVEYDYLVLALGGGSWKITGSDGKWVNLVKELDIKTSDFYSMNCGFEINWSDEFKSQFETMPIKYVEVSFDNQKIKGDIMLTNWGVEGSPIYFLSYFLQNSNSDKVISIDLKPDLSLDKIEQSLTGKKSMSNKLQKVLSDEAIKLIKELVTKDDFLDPKILASHIKSLKLGLADPRPLDEAISTGGGILMSELNDRLALKTYSNIYVGGEMLDWNAPTGGYLLQACFSQGYKIADEIKKAIQ